MSVYTTLMLTQLNKLSYIYRLSCIFLAGKAEDNFVNLQELFKIYPKFPESRILECEIVLLEVRCKAIVAKHFSSISYFLH